MTAGDPDMPAKPKLPGPQTDSRARAYSSPEEEELQRKREDLEALQADLAEAELELATLRSGLVNFERRYLQVVGCRYAELDQLEAQIAATAARRNPQDSSARQKADAAQARARESAETMGDVGQEPSSPEFEPTEELKPSIARRPRNSTPTSPPTNRNGRGASRRWPNSTRRSRSAT